MSNAISNVEAGLIRLLFDWNGWVRLRRACIAMLETLFMKI